MAVAPGTRLGPYEILAPVGAGGMGEVYRARDTRLDRIVAIKVLPSALAGDAQFRARFEREAKSISALSHPNICTLHDVGSHEGLDYLVMEFLDGGTLAARLESGALPVPEAMKIAIEVGDALDKAHRQGIVHRDLKPGNIMLTRAGSKLCDFGLAKVAPGDARAGAQQTAMPTATAPAPLTASGMLLGTFHYMAPEQVQCEEVDSRTDIFAFGAVLFEMLTGRKAFEGRNQASLIGAILKDDPPPVSHLQPVAPPALDYVVRTCLAKDPEDRFRTAHDLLLQLKWITESGITAGAPIVAATRRSRERWVRIALGVVTTLCLAMLVPALRGLRDAPEDTGQVEFLIPTPGAGLTGVISISPDGRAVVFAGRGTNAVQLWLRSLATTEVRPLTGTEGATWVFWSPDSREILFTSPDRLQRMNIDGGPPRLVCELRGTTLGGTRNHEGTIVVSSGGALFRIRASGGEPAEILRPEKTGHTGYYFPFFLSDGNRFLYVAFGDRSGESGIYAGSLEGADPALVVRADSMPVVASGRLFYEREGTLFAQPFDDTTARTTGDPVQIAAGIPVNRTTGRAMFAASNTGALVYRSGAAPNVDLAWFDRTGKLLGTTGDPGPYTSLRLSPDAHRVAVNRVDRTLGKTDIWTVDVTSGIASPLTSDAATVGDVIWSPTGRAVAFWSRRRGRTDFYQHEIGASRDSVLYESTEDRKWPDDWSRDGRFFLFHIRDQLFSVRLEGERTPVLIGRSAPLIDEAQFSPDGRWVAYGSNNSGIWEVYIAAFPAFDNRRLISARGGGQVHWRDDGQELFYLAPDGAVMSVRVRPSPPGVRSLEFLAPARLFQGPIAAPSMVSDEYDVTRDGQRFLFLKAQSGQSDSPPMTVVLNWMAGMNSQR